MIFYLILNILFNSLELHKTSFKGLFLYTWNGETISQVQIGVPLGWNILVYLLLWYFACQAVLRSELLIIGISPRKAPFYHCIDNSVIYILYLISELLRIDLNGFGTAFHLNVIGMKFWFLEVPLLKIVMLRNKGEYIFLVFLLSSIWRCRWVKKSLERASQRACKFKIVISSRKLARLYGCRVNEMSEWTKRIPENVKVYLFSSTIPLSFLVTGHRFCTGFAGSEYCWSCLFLTFCDLSNFVLCGLAVTTVSLIDCISEVNLFSLCLCFVWYDDSFT